MFWFTQEPSSGSQSQCLAKITGMVALCLSICALRVWFTVQEGTPSYTAKHTHTHTQNRSEYAAITLETIISTSTVEPYLILDKH